MKEFYKPKHFKAYELVDKETYEKFGENSFMFFDVIALKTLDGVREYFGKPITVNNWKSGGSMDSRGLRTIKDKTGAAYGQHRFGRAFDFSVQGMTAEEVRKIIIENQDKEPFNNISAIELNVSWIHIDFRNIDHKGIYLFKG
jgi:hypothetical protein